MVVILLALANPRRSISTSEIRDEFTPRYFLEPGTLLHLDVVTIAISTHGIVHCGSSLDRSSFSPSFPIFLSLSLSVSSFNRTRSPRHSSTFCLAVQALPRPCHRENSSVISHGPTRTPA